MARETIDYRAVISDLERKQSLMNARFQAAIAAIQQVMAMNESDPQPALPGLRTLPSPEPATAPYRMLGLVDAAKAHIAMIGRAVPNLELASALATGGFPHRSKNFPNTLNSVLWRRAKTVGDVTKTKKGWALSDATNKTD